jgi:hypothetical protein
MIQIALAESEGEFNVSHGHADIYSAQGLGYCIATEMRVTYKNGVAGAINKLCFA